MSPNMFPQDHLGQDRKVVNHKGYLVPLLFGQVLCVAQNPEARNISEV